MYEVEWIRIWDVAENESTYSKTVVDKIVVDKDVIKVEKGLTSRIIKKIEHFILHNATEFSNRWSGA